MPATPKIRRGPAGPDQLPYGAAKNLNDTMAANGPQRPQQAQQASQQQAPTRQLPALSGDLTGHDSIVFGGTDRPNEPITAGASFGAGPGPLPYRGAESEAEFMVRVTSQMAASPTANWLVKNLAVRALRGE